ncbi:MAG: hypothetical protein HY823_12495 [Acidobacteria bacterium]|nr:hypothetical protein [Acidobacteriota bacterium]
MVPESAPNPAADRGGGLLALAMVLPLCAGLALLAAVNLWTPCLPGWDGAYYFVQVRGLLQGGSLPLPDFPGLFLGLAGLAKILALGMDVRRAIVEAVRWTDTLLPLLILLPAFLLVRDFSRGEPTGRRAPAALLVGLLAVASGSPLTMAGGMIKNGAALPFSLLYAYALDRSLRDPGVRGGAVALLCLLASSFTHASALALNLLFTVALGLARLRAPGGTSGPLLGGLLASGLMALLLFRLDPERGARFLEALLRPGTLFALPTSAALAMPSWWTGTLLGLLGLVALGIRPRRVRPGERPLLAAATVTTLALCFPLLREDVLERTALVSFVPGLVPAAYLSSRHRLGPALLAPVALLGLLHGLLAVKTLRLTGLQAPALAELEDLRGFLPQGRNLVMVHQRLRWWASWSLGIPFNCSAGRALAARRDHDSLLLLEEAGSGAFGAEPARLSPDPGGTLRDGGLLRGASFTVLKEGRYFRLSRLDGPP